MTHLSTLIALAKLHISQHYEKNEQIFTDPETFAYYQSFAQTSKKPKPEIKPFPLNTNPQPSIPKPKAPPPTPPLLPAPPATEPLPKKPLLTAIEREKPKSAETIDFSDFQSIMQKHFPSQKILDHPPDDAAAQERARHWQKRSSSPEILILDSAKSEEERVFLKNVACALESRFFPTAIISPDNWDKSLNVRLVVGPSDALKDQTQSNTVVMEPICQYLQQPQKKAILWKNLKNSLQSS